MMAKRAMVVFAEGFEEIEAVTPVDVLRRAGVRVELVGVEALEVAGAHGVRLRMDRVLAAEEEVDAVILPGGMPGAENLSGSERLLEVLRTQLAKGRVVGAICASPGLVLGRHGLLKGRRATCYPGFEEYFGPGATYVKETVLEDGGLVTSRGPGTALAFALALAGVLAGREAAEGLAEGMLYSG